MKEILMENKNMNADICEACGRIIRTQTFNGMTIRMMCECKREKIEAKKQIEFGIMCIPASIYFGRCFYEYKFCRKF